MLPKNCPCAVLFNLAILETRTINLLPFKNQTQILKRYKSITKRTVKKCAQAYHISVYSAIIIKRLFFKQMNKTRKRSH